MSNQAWALQVMMKHRLLVDFSRRTIDCIGYNSGWYWSESKTFYEALHEAVRDVSKN